ncbi:Type IV fimbrial assembly, ATPase PilB [Labilithrix luteola]|uniref:Type IV fimbrial assembly, ATPase PilB n=1 Tax=Labilithrix luteola TaxID=1391654 RepID=A0A0K1Q562_9BACT|nr:GspE/PulE family protein [Labilithrix luteola]AKV00854.1 Type IV fimbrial assembly, ATPase PilB [Labilithrix luteola]
MTEGLEQGAVIVLDEILRRAVRAHASDIHLEPKRDRLNVRFRVDGEMVEQQSVPLEIAPEVVSRVKVLARMDIAERRLPQDGQLSLAPEGSTVHLRASSFPSSQGEKLVLRILSGQSLIAFEKLGLDAPMQAIVRELVSRPQGFMVTSGPTGAGKTSTLYSFLRLIDTRSSNVVTLEDPIEVELPQITQGQTNVKAGFTFATGLRAILRQDPDVIMVGEIRDAETAGIALQASLTGHLVLSTLHTSDAVETAVRLVDLGVEPWIVANALTAILAQRLVRVVCKSCQETAVLENDLVDGDEVILEKGSKVVRPKGCQVCMRTGYKGRTGIFEAVIVDDDMRELIKHKASPREYRMQLRKRGIPSLRRAGMLRVKEGITTVDEVVRVTT